MATIAAETPAVLDVIDQAMKLSAAERELIGQRLLDSVNPPPNTFDSPEALRAELQRRIEDIESGQVKTYTREETMAYLRQVAAEEGRP